MKIGLPGALFLLFLALKLTGYIDWSWWWVTAPIWLPAAVFLVAALLFGVIGLVVRMLETPQEKAARMLREYGEALARKK